MIQAAITVENVSLRDAEGGGELLAALKPAAKTLRALDTSNMSGQVRSVRRALKHI